MVPFGLICSMWRSDASHYISFPFTLNASVKQFLCYYSIPFVDVWNFLQISFSVKSLFTGNAMTLHLLPLTCWLSSFLFEVESYSVRLLIPQDFSVPSFSGFPEIFRNSILASYHHWLEVQHWFQLIYWWEGKPKYWYLVVSKSSPKLVRESLPFHKNRQILLDFFRKPLVAACVVYAMSQFH